MNFSDNEQVNLYRDDAVVLRTQKLGEADRIVTLLTRRTGRVRAVAKGVRRTKSKFGARLEPFSHVDVQLYTGRSLDIVTQVETHDAFGDRLVADYPRYTAGTAMLETAERLTAEEREPSLRLYLLLVSALRALTEETGTSIDISDDGTVKIASVDHAAGEEAIRRIRQLTADVEVGSIYEGRVSKLMDFGAFVTILPGKDGLVHISQISNERVDNVSDKLTEGKMVKVKVLEIDKQGRIRLSMKDVENS